MEDLLDQFPKRMQTQEYQSFLFQPERVSINSRTAPTCELIGTASLNLQSAYTIHPQHSDDVLLL